MAPADPTLDMTLRDLQRVLHEEMRELPDRYRVPLVLCYLEGLSHEEAARQLGWSKGTLRGRLDRGREHLRRRLTRRGVTLSAALAALGLARRAPAAGAALVDAVVRAAVLPAADGAASAVVSARAAALADGVSRALPTWKVKGVTALLFVAALVAAAGALAHHVFAATKDEPPEAAPPPAPRAPDEEGKMVDVSGRVLDPEGKPVTGARLVFICCTAKKLPQRTWATSAAEGRFRFTVARDLVEDTWLEKPWEYTYVVAAAEGYGYAMTRLRPDAPGNVTLRLVKDDVPIRGRILDLEGKPVPGVTVRVETVGAPEDGDLTAWRAASQVEGHWANNRLLDLASFEPVVTLFPPVTTDADGRFQLRGVGRDRVVRLRITGPAIATREIHALTREGAGFRGGAVDFPPETYYGASFDYVAPPSRPVVGVVRDRDTGRPLAGVTVRSDAIADIQVFNDHLIRTTTDAEGKFRLVGLPKGEDNQIRAVADDQPYLASVVEVPNPPGVGPVTVDVGLKRGVWVEGQVTDKATGKPVRSRVEYFCFRDNPYLKDAPGLEGTTLRWTREDGSFRLVALPGPGAVAVEAIRDRYRVAVGAERLKAPSKGGLISAVPELLGPGRHHTLVPLAPEPGAESVSCDVTLDPGRTLTGTVLGPDGKPLPGAWMDGLRAKGGWERDSLVGAAFEVLGLSPGESRLLLAVHDGQRLAGSLVVRSDEDGPVRLRLQSWGTVTGRLLTPEGKPMTDGEILLQTGHWRDDSHPRWLRSPAWPGKDGRFRIEGLVPGLGYDLHVGKEVYLLRVNGSQSKSVTLQPGETKDLGDLTVEPIP